MNLFNVHVGYLYKRLFFYFSQLSLADISVACITEMLAEQPYCDVIKANKPVSDLIDRVKALPNIKAWIESRPVTQF